MIFGIYNERWGKFHWEQVLDGFKTQTRRKSDRYRVGESYAVQKERTGRGIARILITGKVLERKEDLPHGRIAFGDAWAEGGYGPEDFERLYERLDPGWTVRWAYSFKLILVAED